MTTYREAAVLLWGEAGGFAHDVYKQQRDLLYPELPDELPIVVGITAYGHCLGLTRLGWADGPRISLASQEFAKGRGIVADVMIHEMLHVWLHVTGQPVEHDTAAWYEAVRRFSPAVLGRELNARRGGDRRSVRVPNPLFGPDDERKTVVRKVPVAAAVPHVKVAGWPGAFRPADWSPGEPIACPSY